MTAAAGVFRHLIHHTEPGDRAIELWGIRFAIVRCGAAAIPTGTPHPEWPWCVECWSPQADPETPPVVWPT